MAIGVVAVMLPVLALTVPSLAALRAFDIPLTLVMFLPCALITIRAEERRDGVLVGLLACVLGVTIALLGLVLDHQHPWWP